MKASMSYLRSTKTGREFLIAREDADGDWQVAHDLAVGEVCDIMKAVAWSEAQDIEPLWVDLTVGGQRLRVTNVLPRIRIATWGLAESWAPIESRDAYQLDIDAGPYGGHVARIITDAEPFALQPARQPCPAWRQ